MKNQIALADSDISYEDKKKKKNDKTTQHSCSGVLTIIPLGEDILYFFPYILLHTLIPQNTHWHVQTFRDIKFLFLIVANNYFPLLKNWSKSLDWEKGNSRPVQCLDFY